MVFKTYLKLSQRKSVSQKMTPSTQYDLHSSFSLANPKWPPHSTCPGRNLSTSPVGPNILAVTCCRITEL